MALTSKKELKAFTILEIVISLSIGALLISLGLAGFYYFSRSTEFNQARSEIFLTIRDVQNRARNSVGFNNNAPLTSQVEGYALFFNATALELRYCSAAANNAVACTQVLANNVVSAQFDNLNFSPQPTCSAIFFERISSNIYSLAASGGFFTKQDNGACNVTFSHAAELSLNSGITFNLTNNSFSEI